MFNGVFYCVAYLHVFDILIGKYFLIFIIYLQASYIRYKYYIIPTF